MLVRGTRQQHDSMDFTMHFMRAIGVSNVLMVERSSKGAMASEHTSNIEMGRNKNAGQLMAVMSIPIRKFDINSHNKEDVLLLVMLVNS